jgi:hypothetical protein
VIIKVRDRIFHKTGSLSDSRYLTFPWQGLVIYSSHMRLAWCSHTWIQPYLKLRIQINSDGVVVVHISNSRTWEGKAGGSLWVQNQHSRQSEFQDSQSLKKKKKKNSKNAFPKSGPKNEGSAGQRQTEIETDRERERERDRETERWGERERETDRQTERETWRVPWRIVSDVVGVGGSVEGGLVVCDIQEAIFGHWVTEYLYAGKWRHVVKFRFFGMMKMVDFFIQSNMLKYFPSI